AGAVFADQGVHFTGVQREVDVLYRRRALVELAGAGDLQAWLLVGSGSGDVVHDGSSPGCSSGALSRQLAPLETISKRPSISRAAMMPWWWPSKRLCSESMTSASLFRRNNRP